MFWEWYKRPHKLQSDLQRVFAKLLISFQTVTYFALRKRCGHSNGFHMDTEETLCFHFFWLTPLYLGVWYLIIELGRVIFLLVKLKYAIFFLKHYQTAEEIKLEISHKLIKRGDTTREKIYRREFIIPNDIDLTNPHSGFGCKKKSEWSNTCNLIQRCLSPITRK